MARLVEINRDEAIKVMERNIEILKQCNNNDTFLVLSYDLNNGEFIGRKRLNYNGGVKLIRGSKTFILNHDTDEDPVSVLSMYTEKQLDIFNIIPKGKKHDMLLATEME